MIHRLLKSYNKLMDLINVIKEQILYGRSTQLYQI